MTTVTFHAIVHSVPYPTFRAAKLDPEFSPASQAVGRANLRICAEEAALSRELVEQIIEEMFTPAQVAKWGIRITTCEFDQP